MDRKPEFELDDRDFRFIQELIGARTGIVLGESKRQLVYSRLARRIRHLGLNGFRAYCGRIQEDDGECVTMVNALTTNLTSFFREQHHFARLAGEVIPAVAGRAGAHRRLRIWSAGCSTGEEPYSIAMTVLESLPRARDWDIRILATDLDTEVLHTASSGVYSAERVKGLPEERLRRWFRRGRAELEGKVRIADEVRELVTFRQLNLVGDWPMHGPFDVIFCRNVVIYFSKETQRALFDRMADLLAEGGYLMVGHSESLFRVSDRFHSLGQTTYRRCA